MPIDFALAGGAPSHAPLHEALRERRFAIQGAGYRCGEVVCDVTPRWLVLHEETRKRESFRLDPRRDGIGLWKSVRDGAEVRRVFEIPAWVASDWSADDGCEGEDSSFWGRLLDWALETRRGRVPEAWQPPPRDLVETWIPRDALTVQADGLVRQGELVLEPDRWALRIPLLPDWPEDLPSSRRRALEELAQEAQSLWAMVRFGLRGSAGQRALDAEVNLTGAPHSESLLTAGWDVLRLAVARLAETASVLADNSVVLESLDIDCKPKT